MRFRIVAAAAGLASLALAQAQPAAAIGCVSGGLAGAIAGHAVHHGVMGAVGGCVAGHYAHKHQTATAERRAQQNRASQVDQTGTNPTGTETQPPQSDTSHTE